MKKFNVAQICFLIALLFFPDAAFAADENVFSIISSKLISTVKDVRDIVYIVAGFGLIMFAVLAIFNKISFKHLAYICIGLFLLAVMTPFINYFTGANLADELETDKLKYGRLIDPDNPEIQGSDITEETAEGDVQSEGNAAESSETEINPDDPCDGEKVTTSGGKVKCCKYGANEKGTGCKVTLGGIVEGVKDGIEAAKEATEAVQNAVMVAGALKNMVQTAGGSFENIVAAFRSSSGPLDAARKMAQSLGMTTDQFITSFNQAIQGAQGAVQNAGDAAGNLGYDDFSDYLHNEDSRFNQLTDSWSQQANDVRDGVNDVYEGGQDLGELNDVWGGIFSQLQTIFGN